MTKDLFNDVLNAWNQDRFALALLLSQRLLTERPKFGHGLLIHGTLLYELNRFDEAEQAIRDALPLLPESSTHQAYARLGHLEKDRGCFDAAECHYRRAIDNAPDHPEPLIFLGSILKRTCRFDEAEKCFTAAVECTKGYKADALLNLGYLLRSQGRFREAGVAFEQFLQTSPKHADAVDALVAQSDVEAALQFEIEDRG
ncbi:MAG: tetratricopeptide repeat protein [Pirellulaceae bacterium]|jgi:tetratricopeptide (TPR) repeat protein|nr:tetratricopeptide repeat protein [Pirellulaceae bacterium]